MRFCCAGRGLQALFDVACQRSAVALARNQDPSVAVPVRPPTLGTTMMSTVRGRPCLLEKQHHTCPARWRLRGLLRAGYSDASDPAASATNHQALRSGSSQARQGDRCLPRASRPDSRLPEYGCRG